MSPEEEQRQIKLVVDRLSLRYPEKTYAQVSDAVARAYGGFAGGRIRDFIPLLVERHADQELARAVVPVRP
ncbi:three-helix bundle dimerization domain-containing protein [Rhodococcus sp. NPDC127528]|uniref:three-helix bundle dimerization domain-containing protein n=1 Tax=unclassified Rhodococcus (in: high G+C Gram-positive bacteria) TaxID=192944 RepID=UPI0036349604